MIKVFVTAAMMFLLAGTARSQSFQSRPPSTYTDSLNFRFRHYSVPDSLTAIPELRNLLSQQPAAGSMRKGFRYDGNNGKSFEVFQTYHDHMYILKPDSTFSSNMPVITIPFTGEIRN